MKTAIITGLCGQDGSYLAEQLLERDYKVYGMIRRSSRGLDLGCAEHPCRRAPRPQADTAEGNIAST